ncbi:MAG: antibiotic biosynthesis monooxygenase family protein [Actinomycetota bacterium]
MSETAPEASETPSGASETGIDSDATDPASPDEMEPVMVVLSFRTDQPAALMEVLAQYVVLSRGQPGCRNIDYVASVTTPDRLLIIEKWESADTQRAHFDSQAMVDMATNTVPLLKAEPDIDLFEGISMHDLA